MYSQYSGMSMFKISAPTMKRAWILLLFVAIIPAKFSLISFAQHVYLIPSDFLMLLFIFYSLLLVLQGRFRIGPVPFFPFGFALISIIAASFNANSIHAIGYVKIFLFDIFAFYAGTILISHPKDLEYFLIVVLLFGTVLALGALVQFLNVGTDILASVSNLSARERWMLRVGGTWTYPAYLGAGLNLLMPIAVASALVFSERPKIRRLSQLAVILMLLAAAATVTRSVLLSAAVSLFLLMLYFRRRLLHGRVLVALGAVALLVFISPLGQLIQGRFLGIGQSDIDQASFEQRFELWDEAIALFQESPLIGIGPFSFLTKGSTDLGSHQIHNYWLQILAELGLFGLTAFVVLFGLVLLKLYRGSRNIVAPWRGIMVGVMISWTALMLQALSDNHLFGEEFGIALWLITGAVWHLDRVTREANVPKATT
jgi:putative inorganic carbon (HCO3(-)) transporter